MLRASKELDRVVASELSADVDCTGNSADDRQAVLKKLAEIVRQWVKEVAVALKQADPDAVAASAMVVPYGSSTLGGDAEFVQDSSTDLDVLCIVPDSVSRDAHFFGVAVDVAAAARGPASLATRLAMDPLVSNLVPVVRSFVPCIKLCYSGVPVDLTFCAFPLELMESHDFVPEKRTERNTSAVAPDETAARSLAALQAAEDLRNAIPDQATFGSLMSAVRLWAMRRGVYGKHLGFPGGAHAFSTQ
eukprot:SAG31_NODE_7749_length_1605_cov_1.111554_2_plen_247_part_00